MGMFLNWCKKTVKDMLRAALFVAIVLSLRSVVTQGLNGARAYLFR